MQKQGLKDRMQLRTSSWMLQLVAKDLVEQNTCGEQVAVQLSTFIFKKRWLCTVVGLGC